MAVVILCYGCGTDDPLSFYKTARARIAGDGFAVAGSLGVGERPWALVSADFDKDGSADVATANFGDGTISLLYNRGVDGLLCDLCTQFDGDTTFGLSGRIHPRAIEVVDINSDTWPDLIVTLMDSSRFALSDTLMVFLNTQGIGGVPHFAPTVPDTTLVYTSSPPDSALWIAVPFDGPGAPDRAIGVGHGARDLFVGQIDNSGQMALVVVSTDSSRSTVLKRPTRPAQSGGFSAVAMVPEDGSADVALDASIELTFNKTPEVTAATDSNYIHVRGRRGVLYDISVTKRSSGSGSSLKTALIVTPKGGFAPHDSINVSFDVELPEHRPLRSTSKDTLDVGTGWSFGTEGLKVFASSPATPTSGAETRDVAVNAPVRVRFNWGIDPGSVTTSAAVVERQDGSGIQISGFEVEDSRTVSWQTQGWYDPYELIKVVLTSVIADSLGAPTFGGHEMEFYAEGPKVVSTSPSHASTATTDEDVGGVQTPVLRAWFNTAMRLSTADADAIQIVGSQTGFHQVVDVLPDNSDGLVAKIIVDDRFAAGEMVAVTVEPLLTSQDVGASAESFSLTRPHVWQFLVSSETEVSFAPGIGFDDGGAVSVVGGDFSGSPGVIIADTSGDIRLYTSVSGAFESSVVAHAHIGQVALKTGDINRDGNLDLVMTNRDSVAVLLGDGSGGFANLPEDPPQPVGSGLADLFVGDFNGDGWLDVAAVNTVAEDVSVLLNDGAGVLTPEVYYKVGRYPRQLIGADFDSDGDIDLAVVNSGDNTVTFLRNLTGSVVE